MAYASWSVVFGEQPSAAKWNILGTNDAAFNNGGGVLIGGLAAGATTLGYDEDAGGLLGTSYATYPTLTATSTGGVVRIRIGGFIANADSGANRTYSIKILLDGVTTVKEITGATLPLISGASLGHWINFTASHTPSAASHTWAFQMLASAAGSVSTSSLFMEVAEVK